MAVRDAALRGVDLSVRFSGAHSGFESEHPAGEHAVPVILILDAAAGESSSVVLAYLTLTQVL